MRRHLILGLAIATALFIAASPSSQPSRPDASEAGDVARGQAIFLQTSFHGTPNCGACHSLQPHVTVVGPSLAHVGTRAAELLLSPDYEGLATTSEELLREAILTRDCKLWGESNRHAVIPEWEGVFHRQELIDLSAFLASLN